MEAHTTPKGADLCPPKVLTQKTQSLKIIIHHGPKSQSLGIVNYQSVTETTQIDDLKVNPANLNLL